MYKWYFGVNNTPERKTEAIAQMALGIGGGGLVLGSLFILAVRWLMGA